MCIDLLVDFEENSVVERHFDEPRTHFSMQVSVHVDGAVSTTRSVDDLSAPVGDGGVVDVELVDLRVLVGLDEDVAQIQLDVGHVGRAVDGADVSGAGAVAADC